MNTNLKEKIQELINNLNVKSYNKTRVNNAIDKIVEDAGGGSDDEGIAVFYVTGSLNTGEFNFELVQGKPKLNNDGELIALYKFADVDCSRISNYDDYFTFCVDTISSFIQRETYITYENDIQEFLNLKIGESLTRTFTKSGTYHYDYTISIVYQNNSMAPLAYGILNLNDLGSMRFIKQNNEIITYGKANKIDKVNQFIYITFPDETLKYSYVLDNGRFRSITFVEVVTP